MLEYGSSYPLQNSSNLNSPIFLLKCHLNAVEMHMKENEKTEKKFIVFRSLFNMKTYTPADLSSSSNERR